MFLTCNHSESFPNLLMSNDFRSWIWPNFTTWLDFIPRSRRPAVLCQFSYWPVFLAWSQSMAPQQEHRNIEIQWDTTFTYMLHTHAMIYDIYFKCQLLSRKFGSWALGSGRISYLQHLHYEFASVVRDPACAQERGMHWAPWTCKSP